MAFLGRERELAQLAEAVRRVAEGRPGRVVLTGPAGIGCTQLLDELSRRVASVPGVVAARGRAYEPAMGIPYRAVSEALASAFDALPDERLPELVGSAAHDLSVLVPELAFRLDGLEIDSDPPALSAPDLLGRRVVESVMFALERLAAGGVLLLVLEDMHFADPATRGLVEALQGVGKAMPICLILSYQPDEIHRRHPMRGLVEQLARDPDYVRVELGPLNAKELEALVIEAADERPPANVVTAIVEGAHGNALMARHLAESAEQLEGIRLSDSFDQLVSARLEAMSDDVARVVRVVAAARMPMEPETVLSTRLSEGRLTPAALDGALDSGYVVEDDHRIVASSDMVAEAVEILELTPERKAIHAAIATQLDAEPALAAWHWARAGRPTEARDANIRAATIALQLDPGETVLGHYEEALELPGTEDAGPEERAALLAGAAGASASAGKFRRAVALQRRAIEARATRVASSGRGSRDAATRLALGEMYADLGRYQWGGGELDGAFDSMTRALGITPETPSRIRARAQALLAQHLMIVGRFEESVVAGREAIATAEAAREFDEDTLAERGHATTTLGVDAAYLGDLDKGLELLADASRMAREAGRLDDLMRAAANRTTLLDLDARREEALEVVQEYLEDAEVGGLVASYGAMLRGNSAEILFQLGRWAEAEAECRFAMGWRMGSTVHEWYPPLLLGLLLTESRGDEEAERLLASAVLQLETVPPTGQWTAHLLRAGVSQALWSGDPEAAVGIAEREWPRSLEGDELPRISLAAATCLEAAAAAAEHGRTTGDAGLIARARGLAVRVLPEAERRIAGSTFGPELGARQEADLSLDVARAHADRIKGHVDPAEWDRIASDWGRRGMPYREATTRWWQAMAILAAAGDQDREAARLEAREPLSIAYRIARELPALPLLREVVDLGRRARVALPVPEGRAAAGMVAVGPGTAEPVAVGPGRTDQPGTPDGAEIAREIEDRVIASLRSGPTDSYGLSPREREVLNIVAEGRTDRDIAARLFISERTVHVHVRRILAKLGVSSRTEAAGVAIRQGLVPTNMPNGPRTNEKDDVASRA